MRSIVTGYVGGKRAKKTIARDVTLESEILKVEIDEDVEDSEEEVRMA